MAKVFVDGSAGTTGLRIRERLENRKDIELIILDDEHRKDVNCRREALNSADIAFLCLPDQAAIDAVSLVENNKTVIIDTSTAHRTNPDWVYGMPELLEQREKIRTAKRIANPGCHASGFIALVAPLIHSGIIDKSKRLSAYSITGFSGGGKKRIEQYNDLSHDRLLNAPRIYALGQEHKHLPEMVLYGGVEYEPIFAPIIAPFYAGMELSIPIFASEINGTIEDVKNAYRAYYKDGLIKFFDGELPLEENGFLSSNVLEGRDDMQISVAGNEERFLLVSQYDNLGKGASGAAIQNMNIVLGVEETLGLNI